VHSLFKEKNASNAEKAKIRKKDHGSEESPEGDKVPQLGSAGEGKTGKKEDPEKGGLFAGKKSFYAKVNKIEGRDEKESSKEGVF